MRFCCLLLVFLCLASACASVENEPSAVSDETSAPTKLAWPAELLPDGFPVAEYSEIYAVEQSENAVKIIMFADRGPDFTFPTVTLFERTLLEQGYLCCNTFSVNSNASFFISRDGFRVWIDTSDNRESELALLNEQSPYGFTYSIKVDKVEHDVEYLFLDYPSPDTDLGLEERVFDTWPAEYLPAGIPMPREGITIGKMEMRKNGLMITITGSDESMGRYLASILQTGFLIVDNTCIGKNGDYFYVRTLSYPTTLGEDITLRLQFCKLS